MKENPNRAVFDQDEKLKNFKEKKMQGFESLHFKEEDLNTLLRVVRSLDRGGTLCKLDK